MARITVEDCLEKIPNRFQLVLAATYRARMLAQGHTPKIDSKNKPGVTALREIAAGKIGIEMLKKYQAELLNLRPRPQITPKHCPCSAFFAPKAISLTKRYS